MGRLSTCYSPVRRFTQEQAPFRARLACVRHAASVQSEPESNSPVIKKLKYVYSSFRLAALPDSLFNCQRPKKRLSHRRKDLFTLSRRIGQDLFCGPLKKLQSRKTPSQRPLADSGQAINHQREGQNTPCRKNVNTYPDYFLFIL